MLSRLFGNSDSKLSDAKPVTPVNQTALAPAAPTPVARSAAAANEPQRVMQDILVLAQGRDLPKFLSVLTDRGRKYAVREEDHTSVALLELGGGEHAIVWANRISAKPAFDALMHRARLDGLSVRQVYEAPTDVLQLLYRPIDAVEKTTDVIEITRTAVHEDIDAMIAAAVRVSASDIHLQADENVSVIKFRVNGALEPYRQLRRDSALTMSHALHAMADPDGKSTAFSPGDYQNAAITKVVSVDGKVRHLKLRFASLKVNNNAWDIVLRLLYQDSGGIPGTLSDLGYDDVQIFDLHRMLARPKGMVALCGTTGSGKSTTTAKLLEILYKRHEGSRLIRTIEDPVEYIIAGARQHPVLRVKDQDNAEAFLEVFRACMRGDPDILSIGECRDHATADLLQHAVQSGHKAFVTVHAGNPFEAIFRLIHMGVGRSDIASDDFVSGVVYQRLLRVLCPDCSVPVTQTTAHIPADLRRRLLRLGLEDIDRIRFAGPGCETCRGAGHIGRTVAAEMLVPDREILHHILRDERLLAKAYWRAGLSIYDKSKSGRTALDQAIDKMAKGLVSPLDVEAEIGPLDDQRSPEEEAKWYERATRQSATEMREERTGL